MKKLIYLLILFPFLGFCQSKTNGFIGTYAYCDSNSCYKLVVNEDSTFNYKNIQKYDSVSFEGKWRMNGKYMEFYKYKNTETIVKVEEFRTDTLKNKIIVELKFAPQGLTEMGFLRGDHVNYFYDGQPISIVSCLPKGMPVWVNLKCNKTLKTNEDGRVVFYAKNIEYISLDYNNYVVQNKKSNYFVVTIHRDAIICGSSKALNWTKWILNRGDLVPVSCNKKVHGVIFKKQ
jgi:hypothetical protein